jgi:hypothetical protein
MDKIFSHRLGKLGESKHKSEYCSFYLAYSYLVITGVDPLKWTVVGLGKGAKKCPKAIHRIQRNFASRSWNWFEQAGVLRS